LLESASDKNSIDTLVAVCQSRTRDKSVRRLHTQLCLTPSCRVIVSERLVHTTNKNIKIDGSSLAASWSCTSNISTTLLHDCGETMKGQTHENNNEHYLFRDHALRAPLLQALTR
jgi:hypothetical protein